MAVSKKKTLPLKKITGKVTDLTIKEYLRELAASKYRYHIEDDINDFDFPKEIKEILAHNSEIMWDHEPEGGVDIDTFIWDNYPWHEYTDRM